MGKMDSGASRKRGVVLPLVVTPKQTEKILGCDCSEVEALLRSRALRSVWVKGRKMICGFTIQRLIV